MILFAVYISAINLSLHNLYIKHMFPTTFDQHRKFQGPGRKRRSDDENRNFVCPCGKSYFSYTALWTHTKQKHNGVPLRNQAMKMKRGAVHKPIMKTKLTDGRSKSSLAIDIHEDPPEENPLDSFCQYLEGNQKIKTSIRPSLKEIYQNDPLYKLYLDFIPCSFDPVYCEEQDLFVTTCGEALCDFLAEVMNKLTKRFYRDVAFVFVIMIAKCIREKGGDQDWLEKEMSSRMTDYVNYLFSEFYPKFKKEMGVHQLLIFNPEPIGKLIEYFYAWLVTRRYIDVSVKRNPKYFN